MSKTLKYIAKELPACLAALLVILAFAGGFLHFIEGPGIKQAHIETGQLAVMVELSIRLQEAYNNDGLSTYKHAGKEYVIKPISITELPLDN